MSMVRGTVIVSGYNEAVSINCYIAHSSKKYVMIFH